MITWRGIASRKLPNSRWASNTMMGPLVERGLPNLLKSGWVIAHPAHSSLTSLRYIRRHQFKKKEYDSHLFMRENQRKIWNLFCLVCLNQILKGVFQLGIVNIMVPLKKMTLNLNWIIEKEVAPTLNSRDICYAHSKIGKPYSCLIW